MFRIQSKEMSGDVRGEMEQTSRFCEVSTYTQSSGYNSSTASSSLNYIDEDHLQPLIITTSTKQSDNDDPDKPTIITKLIITITLVKFEEKVFRSVPCRVPGELAVIDCLISVAHSPYWSGRCGLFHFVISRWWNSFKDAFHCLFKLIYDFLRQIVN